MVSYQGEDAAGSRADEYRDGAEFSECFDGGHLPESAGEDAEDAEHEENVCDRLYVQPR